MARVRLPILLAVMSVTLAACLDDPAVRERLGVDENGRPIGASASPVAAASPSASPSPSFIPFPSRSPAVTPSPTATVTPGPGGVPGATGHYRNTWDPLDIALSGPGYLVLSTRPDPRTLEDLLFTRYGSLDLKYVPSGSPAPGAGTVAGPGEWRLQTSEGLHVLGFNYEGNDDLLPPAEAQGRDLESAFTLGAGSATRVVAGPIVLDSLRNPSLSPAFNFKGQLTNQNRPPTGVDGEPRQVFVAIARLQNPQALKPQPGLPTYRYTPEAGVIQVGIAGVRATEGGLPRPVGDAVLIMPETVEE